MPKKPQAVVLRTAGTNCDKETLFAFQRAGAAGTLMHINELLNARKRLSAYHILAIPGGFSYGDDLGAGKILANELRFKLRKQLLAFLEAGKLIIGICNGFQVLVKTGILPGNELFQQEASLIINDSAKFEDRWTYLKIKQQRGNGSKCVWTKNIARVIYLPVAHGEGKFVVKNENVLKQLMKNHQIVCQYCDGRGLAQGYPHNPNGSIENIAGICDNSGRVFGLMPHPERHLFFHQHPHWTRRASNGDGDGMLIFQNGVDYAKKNLV